MSKFMSMLEKLNIVEKPDKDIDEIIQNNDLRETKTEEGEEEGSFMVSNNVKSKREIKAKYHRNVAIGDIYSMHNLRNSEVNTIFMLGNFIKALPENLPSDVKQKSVMDILKASNADLKELLSDGETRLETLNEFIQDYEDSIVSVIDEYDKEINKLKELIVSYNEKMESRGKMLEDQKKAVQCEIERINNIINFFDGFNTEVESEEDSEEDNENEGDE